MSSFVNTPSNSIKSALLQEMRAAPFRNIKSLMIWVFISRLFLSIENRLDKSLQPNLHVQYQHRPACALAIFAPALLEPWSYPCLSVHSESVRPTWVQPRTSDQRSCAPWGLQESR